MMPESDEGGCPLTAADAYELKFEMQRTRKTLESHSEQMDSISEKIGQFERRYFEGRGVALGMKIGAKAGALGVIACLASAIIVAWMIITGNIQIKDVFKMFL